MRSWGVLGSSVMASSVMARSIGLAVDVVNQDAGAGRRHHQPLLMLERPLGILMAALKPADGSRRGHSTIVRRPARAGRISHICHTDCADLLKSSRGGT